jgi:hypothetical protein
MSFGTCKRCGATMNFPVHVCLGPNAKDAQIAGFIDDGFGNRWSKCKPDCRMQIVRPGKVQCACDHEQPPAGGATAGEKS